jgi:hypothetical protein
MRHQQHDDEVYLQRRRHPTALGYPQRCMRITLIMMLYHRKSRRHGFYCPTVKDDAMEIITKCKDCHFFQKQIMKHVNPFRSIDLSWPFAIWGIDIVGVLPRAPRGFRFLFVTIDIFTKWIEAMQLVNITQEAAAKFL